MSTNSVDTLKANVRVKKLCGSLLCTRFLFFFFPRHDTVKFKYLKLLRLQLNSFL